MAKGGSRTSGSHSIDIAPKPAGTEARPASSSDASYGPSHPTSRKPSGSGGSGGGGHGGGK